MLHFWKQNCCSELSCANGQLRSTMCTSVVYGQKTPLIRLSCRYSTTFLCCLVAGCSTADEAETNLAGRAHVRLQTGRRRAVWSLGIPAQGKSPAHDDQQPRLFSLWLREVDGRRRTPVFLSVRWFLFFFFSIVCVRGRAFHDPPIFVTHFQRLEPHLFS